MQLIFTNYNFELWAIIQLLEMDIIGHGGGYRTAHGSPRNNGNVIIADAAQAIDAFAKKVDDEDMKCVACIF